MVRSSASRKHLGYCPISRKVMKQAPGIYEKLLSYFKDEGLAPESFALEMTLIDYGLTHDQSQFITEIQIPLNPDCPGIIA